VPGLLVALQIALTCVLLVMGGLFIRTLRALQDVKLGFDPRGITTLVLMPENLHQGPELSRQTYARLLERFEKLPGVQSATLQTAIPFSNYNSFLNGATEVDGRAFQKGDTAFYSMVSSNFVRVSGIQLTRGRGFVPADEASAAMIALVNQAFVQKYLPQREPIGASIRFHRNLGETDADLPFTQPLTVVGVVENELQGGNLGAPYEPMVYMDYRQLPKNSLLMQVFNFSAQFAVRSSLPQATVNRELRAAVQQIAPDMVEMNLQPMEEGISQSLGARHLALRLVAGFAVLALVLSAIGIYGVLAYSVALRRKEIGVRMALGSSRSRVAQLIAGQAGVMVLCGLIPGFIGAWTAGTAVKSFLFGVSTADPWTYCAVAGLLLLVCAIAAIVPASQATKVDPMEALRIE
jgi:predicted permease